MKSTKRSFRDDLNYLKKKKNIIIIYNTPRSFCDRRPAIY